MAEVGSVVVDLDVEAITLFVNLASRMSINEISLVCCLIFFSQTPIFFFF